MRLMVREIDNVATLIGSTPQNVCKTILNDNQVYRRLQGILDPDVTDKKSITLATYEKLRVGLSNLRKNFSQSDQVARRTA